MYEFLTQSRRDAKNSRRHLHAVNLRNAIVQEVYLENLCVFASKTHIKKNIRNGANA